MPENETVTSKTDTAESQPDVPILKQILQQLKAAKGDLRIEQLKNSQLEQKLQAALEEVDFLRKELEKIDKPSVRTNLKFEAKQSHLNSAAELVPLSAENCLQIAETSTEYTATTIIANLAEPSLGITLTPEDKIALFRSLFLGRPDAFAVRWESESTGASGYQPARNHDYRSHTVSPKTQKKKCPGAPACPDIPVSDEIIKHHLQGKHTIGTYALLPDDTCFFLAIDLDDKHVNSDRLARKTVPSPFPISEKSIIENSKNESQAPVDSSDKSEPWKDDAKSLLSAAIELGVPAYIERSRSGKGGHLWVFFEGPVPAAKARRLGEALITKANRYHDQIRLNTYDRMFPNQDTMPERGYGNLIALPLQKKPLADGNSAFLDENFLPYQDQWRLLGSVKRMPEEALESMVRKASRGGQLICVPRPSNTDEGDEKVDPWALPPSRKVRNDTILTAPLPAHIDITLGNQIYIAKEGLNRSHLNRIKRIAAFQNPKFYENQALRISNHDTPRIICCAEDFDEHLALPRGTFEQLKELFELSGVQMKVEDRRFVGTRIKAKFTGKLLPEQKKAADELLQHDAGVLSAVTGFGKTVLAAYCISKRKTNTLVIVHRQQLLRQWKERLSTFLELPENSIGQIGAGKRKPSGVIDVAMVRSLYSKGEVDDLVAEYGHVIVDECHGVGAVDFEQILRQVKAKCVLGLTATPIRYDGHHPIIVMQCGPIRYRVREHDTGIMEHIVLPRITESQLPEMAAVFNNQEIVSALTHDEERNNLIVADVLKAVAEKRSPLVLTKRKEHLQVLYSKLEGKVKNILVFQGGLSAKKIRQLDEKLASIPASEERVVLAIGECIGEGFDDSRLDTLFLTMPISWHGRLEQYAGRLHRAHEGKTVVRIYDYVDIYIEKIYRMFKKRVAGYKRIGYKMQAQSLLETGASMRV